ncbi:MAG: ATP-binding protein [Chloroflexaceae bacterium]|nr:ATP-binding protein [Chloroflexaceae bacterium]
MNNDVTRAEQSEKIIELRLPSKLGYERVAMDAASTLANKMGFHRDRVDALKTAIAEAVTNAIEHGNQHNETMKVVVLLTVREGELIISVTDQSDQSIPPEVLARIPKIDEKFTEDDKGGWGIWLIRELMDEVEFKTAPTGGNQIRMVIHLEQ